MEAENQPSIFNDLSVTHSLGNQLIQISKWTRFMSILGIIFLGLFLLVGILFGTAMAPVLEKVYPGLGSSIGGALIVVIILFIGIFGTMLFFLLRFTIRTKRGIELRNQQMFNEGLRSLKIYFLIYGVLAILGLVGNVFTLFKGL